MILARNDGDSVRPISGGLLLDHAPA